MNKIYQTKISGHIDLSRILAVSPVLSVNDHYYYEVIFELQDVNKKFGIRAKYSEWERMPPETLKNMLKEDGIDEFPRRGDEANKIFTHLNRKNAEDFFKDHEALIQAWTNYKNNQNDNI